MKSALAAYFEKVKPFVEILKLKSGTVDISIILATSGMVGVIDARAAWSLIAGMLAHSGCDIINDIYDREIDRICKPKAPIPSGRMSLRAAWIYMTALFVLSLLIGWYLGWFVFLCIIIGIAVGGIGYSHPKFRLKDVPMLAAGIIAFGLTLEAIWTWQLYAPIDKTAIEFFVYIFFLIFTLALLKDFRDVKGDTNSLPIMFGVKKAAKICSAMVTIPLLILVLLFIKYKTMPMLIASVVLFVALLPIERILLYKDVVALGKSLKSDLIIAIISPNFSIFFSGYPKLLEPLPRELLPKFLQSL